MSYPQGMASQSSAPNHPYPPASPLTNSFRDRAWKDMDLVEGSAKILRTARKEIEALVKAAPCQGYPTPLYADQDLLPAIDEMMEMLESDGGLIERVAGI
ncbi:hypothetical protein [Gluconacetobacter diazotrophicus]|uniref:hypothetical protein n=1 Tax=Gluconacetobacter diazotrophicus TaxID=33996 RepID=UPI00119C6B46|nr:hypothetical protein [Gluconacetobacter diazotrophicus]TWB00394.1 hypothetical protein FBZ86_1378 [Gluconacetobacter diazotrophicus]